ncbi:DUF2635 domain-containing protein [Chitinibacter sp. S2-10]|uniref:DUF2635 domain-containing protein n=1 Tax=Chitinibacter sp. S2-10 TaxID=3373597 RepID=UPI00397758DF
MKVIAAPGLKVPYEDKPNRYITADQVVDVPDTVYYRRRIADGDLRLPASKPASKPAKTAIKAD